jgi:DNA-directed RNA polymerase subunit L
MGEPTVKNFKVKSLKPTVSKDQQELLKGVILEQSRVGFELHNASEAMSNAIRRVVAGEMRLKHLEAEYDDIKTNDIFLIPEMLQQRIMSIPLLQKVPADVVFIMNVENSDLREKTVSFSDLVASDKKQYFDQLGVFCRIKAGTHLRLKATVHVHNTNELGHGMVTCAGQAASVALDKTPVDYLGDIAGDSSFNSAPRVHRIEFTNYGMMEPKLVLTTACDLLTSRLARIKEDLINITGTNNEYLLHLMGETDTTANLIMREAWNMFPKMQALTYSKPPDIRSVTIKMKTIDNPKHVLRDVIDKCIKDIDAIKAQI